MDYFDQIDEYLNNALSESDKIAFEVAMEADGKLKQAVDDYEVAMGVVGSILESEVRLIINNEKLLINNEVEEIGAGELKIENVEKSEGNKEGKKEMKVRRMDWMRWGAAAAVIFVLGWWGINNFSDGDNSKLYASTYIDPTWPIEKGGDVDNLSKSISKYLIGFEEEAKSELMRSKNPEASYWLSEIYYKEMKFDSTILFIPKEIAANKNKRDRINYLEILSLYFSEDKRKSKEAFDNLPQDTDIFYLNLYSKLPF